MRFALVIIIAILLRWGVEMWQEYAKGWAIAFFAAAVIVFMFWF